MTALLHLFLAAGRRTVAQNGSLCSEFWGDQLQLLVTDSDGQTSVLPARLAADAVVESRTAAIESSLGNCPNSDLAGQKLPQALQGIPMHTKGETWGNMLT